MIATLEGRLIRADAIEIPSGFDREASLVEDDALRKSIELNGIQQPLVVLSRPDGKFSLIDGFRRLEIARVLDIKNVPAVVDQLPEGSEVNEYQNRLRFVLDESRQDLLPSQRAFLIRQMMRIFELTGKDVAAYLGLDAGSVSNYLAIEKYESEIIKAIDTGEVTAFSARAFDGLAPEAQSRIFRAHRKEMSAMSGGAFHKMIRARYSPAKYPNYYTSPEKTQEKLQRRQKGRRTKARPSYTTDEKKTLLRSLELQAVQLEDAEAEHKHKTRCCTLAGPIANGIMRSDKIVSELLTDGKTAELEELQVFCESF